MSLDDFLDAHMPDSETAIKARAMIAREVARRTASAARPLKTCLTCNRHLPGTAFKDDPRSADGLHTVCRDCQARADRRRRG